MEPLTIIVKFLAVAWFTMVPTPTGTVDIQEPQISYVANINALYETPETLAPQITVEQPASTVPPADDIAAKEGLQLPLAAGQYDFTSNYGPRCVTVPGASSFHRGVDLAAPYGTPMYAIAPGTITKVVDGSGSLGGTVVLQTTINGETISFFYHHMENSSQFVHEGQQVSAGQQISAVASTGVSGGSHLHLEVWVGGYPGGSQVNPEDYFNSISLPVIQNARHNYVTEEAACQGGAEGPRTYDTGKTPTVPTYTPPQVAQQQPQHTAEPSSPPVTSTPEPTTPPVTSTPEPTTPPVTSTPEPTTPPVTSTPEPTTVPEPTPTAGE